MGESAPSSVTIEEPKAEETKEPPKTTKKKKKVEFIDKFITLQTAKRGGNKTLTIVSGLDLFAIPLKDAAKSMRKQFACGCSVVEQTIEVQGSIQYELMDWLPTQYPNIPSNSIKTVESTIKKKKFKK